jgi:DNA-binding transcriptional LysR family regulator
MELRLHAVIAGLGLGLIPPFNFHEELRTGSLVPLLRNYPTPELSIAALYPHRQHLPAKVHVFIDALARAFAGARLAQSGQRCASRLRPDDFD